MSLAQELRMRGEINSIQHESLLSIVMTAEYIGKQAQKFFKKFDITQAQYNILIVLKLEGKNLNQVELGERLVVSRAGITSVIDKLETKGYIARKKVPSDRRVYEIEITRSGKELLNTVEPAYVNEVERVMKVLNNTKCRLLNKSLEILRKEIHKRYQGGNRA